MKPSLYLAIILSFLALLPQYSQAEAVGPVGNAMHKMLHSLECLLGQLPAFLCKGDLMAEFSEGAREGRLAMRNHPELTPESQQHSEAFFDRLDRALESLDAAITKNDTVARRAALVEIRTIMEAAHKEFKPPATHP